MTERAPQLGRTDVGAALDAIVGTHHATASNASLAALGIEPRPGDAAAWLVRPGSAAEVSEVIRLAGRHQVAVIPVGMAARPPGDRLRRRPRFYLDCKRMNHVLHLDETSLVVHVQAGLTALGLEKILAPRGLSLGDFPPSALRSTIGGLLAVRTPGKSTPRHGFIEDAVLGVSAVLPDGRSVHTRVAPRRSTGPDLARAFLGSEGTLGVLTSVVLRIHRRPEARLLAAFAMPGIGPALSAVRLALREEAAPAALRVYDAAEARAQLGDGACRAGEALLVTATAGPTDLAACDRDLLASAADAEGGQALDVEIAERWWKERIGYTPREAQLPALQVSATPGRQLDVYWAVLAAAEEAGARSRAYVSRFDLDGAVLFFTFTAGDEDTPVTGEQAARALEVAEEAAAEAGGYLLGRGPRALSPYFDRLRQILDPHGIMNPDLTF